MGQYLSSNFKLYGRFLKDSSWEELMDFTQGNPLSRFKYAVYQYSLQKRYNNMKALYLYMGYTRVCKAHIIKQGDTPYLYLDFYDANTAEMWDKCKEQVENIYVDISWLKSEFDKSWCLIQDDNLSCRKYQNYRANMKE